MVDDPEWVKTSEFFFCQTSSRSGFSSGKNIHFDMHF